MRSRIRLLSMPSRVRAAPKEGTELQTRVQCKYDPHSQSMPHAQLGATILHDIDNVIENLDALHGENLHVRGHNSSMVWSCGSRSFAAWQACFCRACPPCTRVVRSTHFHVEAYGSFLASWRANSASWSTADNKARVHSSTSTHSVACRGFSPVEHSRQGVRSSESWSTLPVGQAVSRRRVSVSGTGRHSRCHIVSEERTTTTEGGGGL